MSLTSQEHSFLEKKIGRKPNSLELQIIAAEWSEHCSYKSSKKHLKILPKAGKRVISGPGYDSGVLEFDDCFKNYALVDVAAVGFGKKNKLIKNRADKDDFVVLIGGSTGRDGMGGSQFASDTLESENRSRSEEHT